MMGCDLIPSCRCWKNRRANPMWSAARIQGKPKTKPVPMSDKDPADDQIAQYCSYRRSKADGKCQRAAEGEPAATTEPAAAEPAATKAPAAEPAAKAPADAAHGDMPHDAIHAGLPKKPATKAGAKADEAPPKTATSMSWS